MKHIIKLLENTLFSPTANLKCGLEGAALGGLLSGVGAVASGAMSTTSQYAVNGQNMRLTREGWKIQQEEAEKTRQFNSEEAEKAREYYSEENIMKRRADAGLNTALGGSDSATSGATASVSSPSISSPIPMQAPDFLPIGDGLSRAISNYFGFKQSDFQNSKISADTAKVLQDIVHEKAMFEVSLNMNTRTLENLVKQGEQLTLKNTELTNAIRIQRLHTNQMHNQLYNDWVTRQMAKDNVKIEGGKFLLMYEKDLEQMRINARNFAEQLRLHKADIQYKYGSRIKDGSNYGRTDQNVDFSQHHAGGSVDVGGKIMGVGANVKGEYDYTTSQQRTTAEMSGVTTSEERTFANSEVGKLISQIEGALMILESPDKSISAQIKQQAIDTILRANYSFEAYQLYYMKLDNHSRNATPLAD